MFNSYSSINENSQSIHINAVSGSILRNHPKSWFITFRLGGSTSEKLLCEGGHKAERAEYNSNKNPYSNYNKGGYDYFKDPDNDIIILQMMLCGEMQVIAECIHRKDFEGSEGEQYATKETDNA